jgi:protein-tyrosine kinase
MSRVDEAVTRAAELEHGAGEPVTHDGTPLPFGPADDLWAPEEGEPDDAPASSDVLAPAPPSTGTDAVAVEGAPLTDEKLISRWIDARSVEQYRRLAARLHLHQVERGTKVVLIASALPGEGKTLTAANLALTLSSSYRRQVLLIDGDLRRPWIHHLFGLPNVAGLNDGLTSKAARKIPLIRWSDHLTLVTAGRPEADPMSVLSSDRMKQIVGEAAATFDWVIIDTPPIGLLSDANLLAALVDTVILVIRAGKTPFYDIQKAVQTLGREAIFGVVLNRTQATWQKSYDKYYYAYGRTVPE